MNYIFKRSLNVQKNVNKLIKICYATESKVYEKNKLQRVCDVTLSSEDKNSNDQNTGSTGRKTIYITAATAVGLGIGFYIFQNKRRNIFGYNYVPGTALCSNSEVKDTNEDGEEIIPGVFKSCFPLYSLEDIRKHNTKENGIWVIYKEGVYDITNFVDYHPGGEIILRAAGGSIEPYWTTYGIHKQPAVYPILESLRIGNISKAESEELSKNIEDPYLTDPERPEFLKPASEKPFNGEPNPSSLLMENFITSNENFYIRNHLPVPVIDPETYKLVIEVEKTGKKLELSLEELKKYEKRNVTATLMCAGNRRTEMSQIRPVKGLAWGNAVIGNAVWSGVYLRDILIDLGLSDESNYKHVQFEGLDYDPSIEGRFYGASVPYNFVMDKTGEVLIAYEMNGEPLSRDHGFPVRMIVPGVCGARNVKWLGKIIVSNEESQAFWQQNDYKSFNSSTDFENADFSKAQAVQKLPVTSAICVPEKGENVKLENGYMTVKGYAFSGGGNQIYRVDVTIDGGYKWYSANLETDNKDPPQHYSWSLWTVKIPVPSGEKEVEIWAKAMDSNHNTQPETFYGIWNIRGILSNAYQRIKVNIVK